MNMTYNQGMKLAIGYYQELHEAVWVESRATTSYNQNQQVLSELSDIQMRAYAAAANSQLPQHQA
jgi:hypothetical protein